MSKQTKRTRNELERLRLPELQARFREVVGETSRSPNRKFLMRRIEEVLAARAEQEQRARHRRTHCGTGEPASRRGRDTERDHDGGGPERVPAARSLRVDERRGDADEIPRGGGPGDG
jgi:hypothetical protein